MLDKEANPYIKQDSGSWGGFKRQGSREGEWAVPTSLSDGKGSSGQETGFLQREYFPLRNKVGWPLINNIIINILCIMHQRDRSFILV